MSSWLFTVPAILSLLVAGLPAQDPQAVFDRAVAAFLDGRLEHAADGFDRVAKLRPDLAPKLWQRGISLYYVGRYEDCRTQFESHRTVNPDDVENAAWHFLCVARGDSPARARIALLPVGYDTRIPMREIYDMFRGVGTPEAVLETAGSEPRALFYAHLYLGLYFEAIGRDDRALKHITAAAAKRYETVGGYMYGVSLIHLRILRGR